MKKKTFLLIALLAGMSILPLTALVIAASGSCSGSPVSCTFTDAFNFLDGIPSVVLGMSIRLSDPWHFKEALTSLFLGKTLTLSPDAFHFLDASLRVNATNPNSPFFVTTTNAQNVLVLTDNLEDALVTQIIAPIAMIVGVIGVASYLKMREFPLVMGITMFTFCGLIWVKILPSWAIVFPIFTASGVLALLMSKFLGNRGNQEG
jgi:hypothetical protein